MLVEATVVKKISVGNPVSVLSPKAPPPLPPSGQKHQLCMFNCKKGKDQSHRYYASKKGEKRRRKMLWCNVKLADLIFKAI